MRTVPQPRCPNCGADGDIGHVGLQDKVYGASGSWDMKHCRNAACGVWWTDPAPLEEDLPIAYENYHTHDSDDRPARSPSLASAALASYVARRLGLEVRSGWLARLLGRLAPLAHHHAQAALYTHFYLPLQRGGKVLEIGCGAGRQLETMARDGWIVAGIDFDPAAVAVARARGLDVSVGDVRELPFPKESFDAVVMAQVLEHVFDPIGLLKRCVELLKPGGRLISITPNADSLGHRIFGRDWRGLEPPRHLVVYTRRALRFACERAGLTVERIDVTARDAANMMLASERIRGTADGALIRRPAEGQGPPLRLRLLAGFERCVMLFGPACGEELVLTAIKR